MATTNVKAYGTSASDAPLVEMNIERRAVLAKDIEIEINEIIRKQIYKASQYKFN
jgi:hypothetical protein